MKRLCISIILLAAFYAAIAVPGTYIPPMSDYVYKNLAVIGSGTAGVDYSITYNGEDNDGILAKWMEDEDYFLFPDDTLIEAAKYIYFRDLAIGINSAHNGHLDLTADIQIDLNAPTSIAGSVTADTFISTTSVAVECRPRRRQHRNLLRRRPHHPRF